MYAVKGAGLYSRPKKEGTRGQEGEKGNWSGRIPDWEWKNHISPEQHKKREGEE